MVVEQSTLQQWYVKALDLHEHGMEEEAVLLYHTILDQIPDADLVHYNLGLALYALEQFDQAAQSFLQATKINPDDQDYWFNAGLALKMARQFEKAQAAYTRALALSPQDVDVMYNMGCCFQAAGKIVQAAESYEQTLKWAEDHISALSNLAYCRHCLGAYDRAAELYRRLLVFRPEHVSAQFMLAALEGEEKTAPPPEYVQQLFDGYSQRFDRDLVEKLSYRVPALLTKLLEDHLGRGKANLRVLDLGCGTGLSGLAVKSYAAHLTGVDLSSGMVAEAEKKGCYDVLAVADVVAYLHQVTQPVDLLFAADVLTYLGDLAKLFRAASTSVSPGALFSFSVERGEQEGWQLLPTGRYGHHRLYIQQLASETGWEILSCLGAAIRKERGQWIEGELYVLAKSS